MSDTVLPTQGFTSVEHINAIGYLMAALLLLVMFPLLPFVILLWLLGQRRSPRPGSETEES